MRSDLQWMTGVGSTQDEENMEILVPDVNGVVDLQSNMEMITILGVHVIVELLFGTNQVGFYSLCVLV
ncbi:MAG: hypothetical protein RTU92_10280 [Candidatus Thorarchaeota archaeon]